MGCGCQKNDQGETWEIVNGDQTVQGKTYASQTEAQQALTAAGGGGFVRKRSTGALVAR